MSDVIERPQPKLPKPRDRTQIMRILREGRVPDRLIAFAFGLTRQRVHKLLGAKPDRVRTVFRANRSDIPRTLKSFRSRNTLTVDMAARMVGVKPNTWYKWEVGVYGPTLPILLMRYLEKLDSQFDGIGPEDRAIFIDDGLEPDADDEC